jgi:glycerol-3-phosphate dehydrogenase
LIGHNTHLLITLQVLVAVVILKSQELSAMVQMEEQLFQKAGSALAVMLPFLMGALGMFGGGNKLSANRVAGKGTLQDGRKPVGTGGKRLTVEEMKVGGSGSMTGMNGVVVGKEQYRARFIVNAAGSFSDKIASMIGDDGFTIKPRLGDYLLLNRNQGHLTKATLFPCPGPLGKGVLVQTTLWGNLILGPTARDKEYWGQSNAEVQEFILSKCKALVPTFDPREVIHAFCGARAKSTRGDWIIEPSEGHPHMIHAAGIDSPGLAGSPAIAVEIVRLLKSAGLVCKKNRDFNPRRAPIVIPKSGLKGLKISAVVPGNGAVDPAQNVVCKCEKVTEAEVISAVRRSLPVDSTQSMRKRTRAGMGHCQADQDNYGCECRVADIIARENGYTSTSEVNRRPWPATSTLDKRWVDDADKDQFSELMAKDPSA